MKILHISKNWFDTVVYSNLFRSLNKYVDQYVFALVASNRNINSENRKIVVLRCIHTRLFGLYRLKISLMLKHIIKHKRDFREFDVFHAHFVFFDGDVAYQLYKKFKNPYIVTVRTSDIFIYDKRFYLRNRGLKILKDASKIIFISHAHKDYLFNKYIFSEADKIELQKKSIIIPNGIDEFWIGNRFIKSNSQLKKKIKILTVAGIDANKNHILVVKAIKKLIQLGYSVEYTIIGKILDHSIFNSLIKHSFVKHIEPLPKEELIKFYREADLFIMTSHSETFGLVYVEALSQGLPIIYTRNQGIFGFFREGEVGFSVDSNDYIELSEIILKTIDNYPNFEIDRIDFDQFDWEKISIKYLDLYKQLASCN